MTDISSSHELLVALRHAEHHLKDELDWEVVLDQLAEFDWVMAVAIAQSIDRSPPRMPAEDALWAQKRIRKSSKISVGVEWGYEIHTAEMPLHRWINVCRGDHVTLKTRGYYEGESFWNYWSFNGDSDDTLVVEYGEDGGQGFLGGLGDAYLDGPTPFGVNVAAAILDSLNSQRAKKSVRNVPVESECDPDNSDAPLTLREKMGEQDYASYMLTLQQEMRDQMSAEVADDGEQSPSTKDS